MKMSKLYMPTLREVPAEAEVPSHGLLLRAGMIRKAEAGLYSYLPLGSRVLRKIENLIREEMSRIEAQELLTTNIQPRSLLVSDADTEIFQFKDGGKRDLYLGYLYEGYLINLIKSEVRSYKQLPLTFYHIHTKYKDELKPKFGLIKAKEYIACDAYSYDKDADSMENSYNNMRKTCENILEKLNINYRTAERREGHEFIALAEKGEEVLVYCKRCGYTANSLRAKVIYDVENQDEEKPMEKVHTPNVTTIEDLKAFFNMEKNKFAKSLIYVVDGDPILVVIPGDRELNEVKLCDYLNISYDQLEMADETVVRDVTRAEKGFAGPVGIKEGVRIIVDSRITKMKNLIVGGNETDYHIKNVNYGRDFEGEVVEDLLLIEDKDPCPKCGEPLYMDRGIEVGYTSPLGNRYSTALIANFLDEDGREKPFEMGSYSLNISRLLAALVEQNHDENGIVWPFAVAPYHVVITVVNIKDESQAKLGEHIYRDLQKEGIEVLLDDRNERAGVKFKDRDLIGIPIRVTVGKRASENIVEYSLRRDGHKIEISVDEVLERIKEELNKAGIKG
jgi:prolyl-tRNA synthetase